MADVNRGNRPLSPHLTIYRPQMTSISSILVRITGNALLVSILLVVWWLLALATSEDYFQIANMVMTSWFGKLAMGFSLLGLWYHTLGGIRHLIWDTGRCLDVATSEKMGWIMIVGSVVLTVITLFIL